MDLADVWLSLLLSFTQLTGDYRKQSPDFASPDIPESLSADPGGLSGASYHDPLPWHHEFYDCNNKHSGCKVRLAL